MNAYLSKAKKFEVKATASDKGTILLDVNVFDGIKLDCTPEQWEEIIGAVAQHLSGKAGKGAAPATARRSADDY